MERRITAQLDGKDVSISDFELEQLIAVVDDDNSGALDMEELVAMLEHIGVENAAVRLHAARARVCVCVVSNEQRKWCIVGKRPLTRFGQEHVGCMWA